MITRTRCMSGLHQLWDINDQTFRTLLEARFNRLPRDGVMPHEDRPPMAGDSIVAHADVALDRVVDIAVITGDVWPWLAQMMRGAGIYGWPTAESPLCRSADYLLDDLPPPCVGDQVIDLFVLARVIPGREMVWHCPGRISLLGHEVCEFSLDYLLTPLRGGRCRLRSRVRGRCECVTDQICRYLFDIIEFLLPAHQLEAIKRQAETYRRRLTSGQIARRPGQRHQAPRFVPAHLAVRDGSPRN